MGRMDNGIGVLPSAREVSELMPEGRRGYAIVRQYFGLDGQEAREDAVGAVLETLHKAQQDDRLQPPLTPEMADAVDRIKYAVGIEGGERYFMLADFLLEAVFEHGYRSDGV